MKILKRLLLCFVCGTMAFSLISCSQIKDERVCSAISVLTDHWSEQYDKAGIDDQYLEIVHARIVNLKDNDVELFDKIDYIVEFILFSNYFDTAPYYENVGIDHCVAVYEDGTTEVTRDLFDLYRARTYITDFSDLIKSIEDFKTAYNQVLKVK